jgi:hypothetical protein
MNVKSYLSIVAATALGFVAASSLNALASGLAAIPQASVGKRAPLRSISSVEGKDLYKAYCAQCHGPAGKGDGSAAAGLKKAPPDLTQIRGRNNGKFSRGGVEAFIKGTRPGGVLSMDSGTAEPVIIYADGTPDEMPVWGILLRNLWPDEPLTIRCGNLARYVESLQAK